MMHSCLVVWAFSFKKNTYCNFQWCSNLSIYDFFLLFYRVVEQCLGRFVDEKKAKQLKEKSMPVEACTAVAGRTDKGVTALQQVCSFC